MTRNHPATPAERTAMSRRMVRASELDDRHKGRTVRIGAVEGVLVSLYGIRDRVDLELEVGGAKAYFQLRGDAEVEHWRVIE